MAKTKILHIQGNEIMIGFPVKEMNAVLNNGVSSTQGKTEAIGESWVVLRRGILVRQYKTFPAHDFVFFSDKGHLPCGVYDIEVYYDTEDGQHMRLKYPQILTIVDSTEAGQIYESDDFDVDAYYPVINSRASAVVISNGAVSLFAGRGLNADISDDSVNLRAGFGGSQVEVTETNVNINIKE